LYSPFYADDKKNEEEKEERLDDQDNLGLSYIITCI
jgi:hypothetical protein